VRKENNLQSAKLLSYLRKKHQLTQKDIAIRFDVSSQAVSKWEKGDNLPDARLLFSISRFYGVTVDEILVGNINHERSVTLKGNNMKYLSFFGYTVVILSVIFRLLFMEEQIVLSVIVPLIFMVMGIIAFIKITKYSHKKVTKFSAKQKMILATTTIVYFTLNYCFGIWSESWLLFLVAYIIILNYEE